MLKIILIIPIAITLALLAISGNNAYSQEGTVSINDHVITPIKTSFITFHNFTEGHDGWTVSAETGPLIYNASDPSSTIIPVINGTDLTDINSNSIIVAQVTNDSVTTSQILSEGVATGAPTCTAWNPFTHGFHLLCATRVMPGSELQIAVLNP